MAIPIPPPIQRVAQPLLLPCLNISLIRVTKILVPEALIGCFNTTVISASFAFWSLLIRHNIL